MAGLPVLEVDVRRVQVDELTSSGCAQDLRISVPASCQQQQQQDETASASYRPAAVTERPPSAREPAPQPSFGLGLVAVGPHTSLSVVATPAASSAALSLPSQSPSANCGTARRRVSDKTALSASTGNRLVSVHPLPKGVNGGVI